MTIIAEVVDKGYNKEKDELWFKWENKRSNLRGKSTLNSADVHRGDLLELEVNKSRNVFGLSVYELLSFRVIERG